MANFSLLVNGATEPVALDFTVREAADTLAKLSAEFGKPEITEMADSLVDFTYPAEGPRVMTKGFTLSELRENVSEPCDRCNGTGTYIGAGIVENGVFKGYKGVCYRCKGTGSCTRYANRLGNNHIGAWG